MNGDVDKENVGDEALFTFVSEYQQGTYVWQCRAIGIDNALVAFCDGGLGEMQLRQYKEECIEESADKGATPLEGLTNAWCATFLIDEELLLVNIIKTQPPE